MAKGLSLLRGNLSVSHQAQLTVARGNDALTIFGGEMKLAGGKITATAKANAAAISVTRDFIVGTGIGTGNIEITDGTLEVIDRRVYMDQYQSTDQQGLFAVVGGSVKTPSIYGANKFIVSGGTVESRKSESGQRYNRKRLRKIRRQRFLYSEIGRYSCGI